MNKWANYGKWRHPELYKKHMNKLNKQMSKEILQFTANWCSPCKMLSPRMEKLKSEGKINYRKIDVDSDTELSIKYGVRNIPTLILLENGDVKNRLTGVQSEQQIIDFYNG